MILDWQNDFETAWQYDVVDPETGEPLPNGDIFYADDEAGLVRYYLRDERGELFAAYEDAPLAPAREDDLRARRDRAGKRPAPQIVVAWAEERRPVRIVRKGGADSPPGAV